MIKGVSEKEETIIKDILKDYPYEFFYYGSRVKGDFTKSSDLDILIKSETEIPCDIIEKLKYQFNNSLIPYIVNLSQAVQMDDYFYKLIEPTLVKVDF